MVYHAWDIARAHKEQVVICSREILASDYNPPVVKSEMS